MTPLASVPSATFSSIRYDLTDIDDTLTRDGMLEEEAFAAVWRLSRAGIGVIPVTGRPAGWCDCIARQWPVSGVVGENGAFAFYRVDGVLKHLYHPEVRGFLDSGDVWEPLKRLADTVLEEIPGTRIAKDQFSRKYDLAIDFREEEPKLSFETADRIKELCEAKGAHAKVSSIHVNAWFGNYDKLSMAEVFLSEVCSIDIDRDADVIVFCGDSPNDEPMFARLAHSVAVANIRPFLASLEHAPQYLCSQAHGRGFAELAELILRHRENG